MTLIAIRTLFVIAALYDGVLGAVFLLNSPWVFERFNVPPPNHWGYVQFPAALLLIFAVMFLNIAIAPRRNIQLIVYGMLLKLAYCGIAFHYWFREGIPWIWKPFAVIDLVMLAMFVAAWWSLRVGRSP